MRVLLLGQSGFVGRNLFEYLDINTQHKVDVPSHKDLDALDETQVVSFLKRNAYDVVLNCLDLHLSADAVYAEQRLRMFHNFAHHRNLFGKMIYFGSGAEYGRQIPVNNVSENDFGRVIPLDSYGFALYQMSEYACMSNNIYNLRLFGIFGKYELWHRRFISNCICKALNGFPLTVRQDRIMDYLYVDDLAKIVQWFIENKPQHHAYNVTSGKKYYLSDLAKTIQQIAASKDVPIFIAKPGFFDEYTSKNQLLLDEIGSFEIESISCSIAKLTEYYRTHLESITVEKLLYP